MPRSAPEAMVLSPLFSPSLQIGMGHFVFDAAMAPATPTGLAMIKTEEDMPMATMEDMEALLDVDDTLVEQSFCQGFDQLVLDSAVFAPTAVAALSPVIKEEESSLVPMASSCSPAASIDCDAAVPEAAAAAAAQRKTRTHRRQRSWPVVIPQERGHRRVASDGTMNWLHEMDERYPDHRDATMDDVPSAGVSPSESVSSPPVAGAPTPAVTAAAVASTSALLNALRNEPFSVDQLQRFEPSILAPAESFAEEDEDDDDAASTTSSGHSSTGPHSVGKARRARRSGSSRAKSHFVCDHPGCKRDGRPFSRKQDYQKHCRTHTNVKPYPCRVHSCDKAFSDPSVRTRHEQTHSSRIYCCPYCHRSYKQLLSAQRHCAKTHPHNEPPKFDEEFN